MLTDTGMAPEGGYAVRKAMSTSWLLVSLLMCGYYASNFSYAKNKLKG
jgi:hypothetical protein